MTNEESQQLIIDYQQTFGSESGQRVLANLRNFSQIDEYLNFMTKMWQPYHAVYAEGRRSIMMHIYTKLSKDPFETKRERAINIEKETNE